MADIVKGESVVADSWNLIRLAEGESAADVALPEGKLIVPYSVWLARRDELLARNALGIWLTDIEGPELIAADLKHFSVIAIDFPKFSNGRGYSSAALLRTRYGYQGELRAIGEVLRDQIFYLARVGFDAFAVDTGRSIDDVLQALDDFSVTYQGSSDCATPLFRRLTRA